MAQPRLHLYYWPSSSFSQKAFMALEECGLKYGTTVINITTGEQHEARYLRINSEGKVPVLKIGDKYVPDSEAIFDAIQELSPESKLVPDVSSAEGKLVDYWRKKLVSDVKMFIITFGSIIHPEVRDGNIDLPPAYSFTAKDMEAKNVKTIKSLEELKAKNPDLTDIVDKKIESVKAMDPSNLQPEAVIKHRGELEVLFDEIEKQLRRSREENIVEHWFCGPNFTVADISLVMIIGRLKMLSYFDRYVNAEKRPAVLEYWNQACRRQCVQTVVLNLQDNLKKYFMKRAAQKAVVGSTAVLAAAGVALFCAKKLSN